MAPGLVAQSQSSTSRPASEKGPGQPDPNDRGGEFIITGCLQQQPATAGQPVTFKMTGVSPGQEGVGEGRAVSAIGAGTPVTGVTHSSAAQPSDPPDIVRGEYRIIAAERTDLTKFVNQKVEARGRLRGSLDAKDKDDKDKDKDMKVHDEAMAKASSAGAAAGGLDVFEAMSVRKVADSCTAK